MVSVSLYESWKHNIRPDISSAQVVGEAAMKKKWWRADCTEDLAEKTNLSKFLLLTKSIPLTFGQTALASYLKITKRTGGSNQNALK